MAFLPPEFINPFTEWLEVSGSLFGVPFTREATSIPPDYFYIGNTSIKKEFLEEGGLFDEDFNYHCTEDWELGIRLKQLGLKSTLIVKADVIHQHEVTLEGRLTSIREQGSSAKLHDAKNQASQSPWHHYVTKPYLFLQLKMHVFRLIHKLTKSKKMLHKQFKYQIKMAFHEGYHSSGHLPTDSHHY
jgi:GT2 family glycosyltransferase